ncbi:thiol:disulfide interchange protein DsbB [Stenotrophomonas rhizophila]|uniref:Disulfide bond formation protein B n=1 Tax=Stenotrophomonas rhizophila TaxID=216778 RepID=A0A498CF01_9GAMM|nr:disulfide bond formation protein B [Stenotrophomonas rhizophila]RLK56416.1 thiol:disulfide interchange protein DsbB [Stenotrophomonas rhizophila]
MRGPWTRYALHPLTWNFQQRFLAGLLGCAGVLLYALYTQYFGGLTPCPLCTLQRGAFMALATLYFLGSLHAPRSAKVRAGYVALSVVIALLGAGVATRHVWLQLLPADQVPACGPDLAHMLASWPLLDVLRQVLTGSGECAVVDWTFLGLSMPAWSLLTYLALALWSALALRAPLRRR